jgi:ZIP family zinc transporter
MWEFVGISALAGVATGLGAIVVLLVGKPSDSLLSLVLGFAAGIMLAISAFSLLPEALALGGTVRAVIGFLAGAGLMFLLDSLVPHLHIGSGQGERHGRQQELLKVGYFIFLGIALHNLPEGLAIGAGFTASQRLGATIAVALALHNVPEGMATAAPLLGGGAGRGKTIILTTTAGLMTPVGTLLGAALFSISQRLVSLALALAAGAMVYIVSDELIPQSHAYHSHMANAGLLAGFLLGMLI